MFGRIDGKGHVNVQLGIDCEKERENKILNGLVGALLKRDVLAL